ncbi:MAG: DUF5606 domain-containing protein [Bacteroidetes bacterium]|nr:DUF5606 domain-containing protein [Bacteroidota bacterium]
MELKEILSVSKLPGLFKVLATRDNGLIVTPLGEDKKKFVSSRQHMFTPLENITIYTTTSTVELSEVFKEMKKKEKEFPLPTKKDSGKKFREYFTNILPDHDQQKVYDNDIKKIVKWYEALDKLGIISLKEEKKEKEKEAKEAKKETKPKAKTTTEKKADKKTAKPKKETKKKDK